MEEVQLPLSRTDMPPIDTNLTPSDSVFISSNVLVAGEGTKDIGKLYWFSQNRIVLDNDVQREIVSCKNNELLICISSPISLILPFKFQQGEIYEIDKTGFSIKIDEKLVGTKACSFDTLEFEVTNDDAVTYRYVLSKNDGLLYFNVRSKEHSFYREMFRLSGNVFSYGEFCE